MALALVVIVLVTVIIVIITMIMITIIIEIIIIIIIIIVVIIIKIGLLACRDELVGDEVVGLAAPVRHAVVGHLGAAALQARGADGEDLQKFPHVRGFLV